MRRCTTGLSNPALLYKIANNSRQFCQTLQARQSFTGAQYVLSLRVAVLLLCFFLLPAIVSAKDITQSIEEQKQKAKQAEQKLEKLTEQERTLHKDLADAADRIQMLQRDIASKENELAQVEAERDATAKRHQELTVSRRAIEKDLAALVETLWPLYIENKANKGLNVPDWHEADREYEWSSRLFDAVNARQTDLAENEEQIARALAERDALREKARKQLAAVNERKNDLLRDKLTYQKRLGSVRKRLETAEENLRNTLNIIQELNFRLEQGGVDDKQFALFKGTLPWPAHGMLAVRYNSGGSKKSHGIGLALAGDTNITAVSTGKVVHNDVLRGFGRVVILLHGSSYYSLYAYLAESPLKVGDTVRRGQPIGSAGFYPDVEGPGLYFELRYNKKAINPESWLTALN